MRYVSDQYFERLDGDCVGVVSVKMDLFACSIDS
jgi:hypothetical protein